MNDGSFSQGPAVEYDPADASTKANPYPLFAKLREERPIYWSDIVKGWVLTRYVDVKGVLGRPKQFSSVRIQPFLAHLRARGMEEMAELGEGVTKWAVFTDQPYHTKLRPVLNQAFLPVIAGVEPTVREIVGNLLAKLERRSSFDLIADFAVPLPTMVILRMFGQPVEDAPKIKQWTDALASFIAGARLDPLKTERSTNALRQMRSYFTDVVEQRKRQRGEDVISRMITFGEKAPEPFTDDEYVQTATLLMFAGHETTTDLIGNGIYNLLRNPDQLAELRAHPEAIDRAIEELLRFDNPAATMVRVTMEDTDVGGQLIRKGERVFCSLLSANHDSAMFPDGDKLDLSRKPRGSLSFGMGLHLCLGAPLARLEGKIAIPAILAQFPHLEIATDDLVWRDAYVIRGITSLPLKVGRATN
ncbi:MAG: cytochrome P450 [Bradyrhizobium sp.]